MNSAHEIVANRNRSAFPITLTDDKAIAAAAELGGGDATAQSVEDDADFLFDQMMIVRGPADFSVERLGR